MHVLCSNLISGLTFPLIGTVTQCCITGNICRSPAAGAVLKKAVKRSGLSDEFEIDSCGTGGSGHENWYH